MAGKGGGRPSWTRLAGMGMELGAAVAGLTLFGAWIDRHWGTAPKGLLTGAAGMILTKVLDIDEAYEAISWSTVFLLASLIPLGQAVQSSGTAAWIAQQILLLLDGWPIWSLQAGLAVLATIFTLIMSNVGATVLLVPLAVSIAIAAGGRPDHGSGGLQGDGLRQKRRHHDDPVPRRVALRDERGVLNPRKTARRGLELLTKVNARTTSCGSILTHRTGAPT